MAVWFFAFGRELDANADTERDLLRTLALVRHGVVPSAGPALDYLPLALPPTWYFLMAPAVALWPDPAVIHGVHAALLLLGVAALARAVGGVAGVLLAAACATSTWTLEVLAPVWHNGLVPGVGLLWLAALFHVAQRRSPGWLAACWVCAGVVCQVHVVGFMLLPGCAVAHAIAWRRDGLLKGPLVVAALVVGGLATAVGVALAGQSWDVLASTLGARAPGLAVGAAAERTLELLGASASVVPFTGPLMLGLALWGVVARGSAASLRLGLALHTAAGFVAAAWLSGLDPAPRYFGPCLLGLMGLAGLGLKALTVRAPAALAWSGAPLAVLLSLQLWWVPSDEPLRESATPSLSEQRTLATALAPHATLGSLSHASHGVGVSALTATRYFAVFQGWPLQGPQRHLFAAPLGFPEPQNLQDRALVPGLGRDWVVGHFEPEVQLRAASVGGRPCALPLPYLWSPLRADELAPFGLAPAFDAESCRSGRTEGAAITLELVTNAPAVVVVLGWFDVARHGPERAFVRAPGATVQRLSGGLYRNVAVFRVQRAPTAASRSLRVEVGPLETLAVLDAYSSEPAAVEPPPPR